MNLVKHGYSISEAKTSASKKSGFSAAQKLQNRPQSAVRDAKDAKQANLGSNNPETFGNTNRDLSPMK